MDDLLPYFYLWLAITVPGAVIGWVGTFRKAGQAWWKAVVPVYNVFVLVVSVAGLSPLWFLLLWIPPVNLIAALLVNVEVARRFGRTESFGLALAVFGFVFYPVLGFGPAKYQRVPAGGS